MDVVVLRMGGDWALVLDGRRRGRFPYEVDAVEAALKLADAAERPARGLVQDKGGELRPLEGGG